MSVTGGSSRARGRRGHGGRPRDPRVEQAALAAAAQMLIEDGYDEMRMEAVAARAGVSKASIYRRWGSKHELAVAAIAAVAPVVPVPDTGDLRSDLVTHLERALSFATSPQAQALGALAANEPSVRSAFREGFILADRRRLAVRLDAAINAGELPATTPVDTAVNLLVGVVLAHTVTVVEHDRTDPDNGRAATEAVRVVMDGLGGPASALLVDGQPDVAHGLQSLGVGRLP